jgi:hypothetical protein
MSTTGARLLEMSPVNHMVSGNFCLGAGTSDKNAASLEGYTGKGSKIEQGQVFQSESV